MSQLAASASDGQAINNAVANHQPEQIKIYMKSQDGGTMVYKIGRKAKLSILLHDYCEKKQFEYKTARFFHEGQRVLGKYTSAKLKLEDGAEIYCMFHQMGAGFFIRPKTTKTFDLLY
ncbi:hypothetical protein REPUB_Repub20aG0059300 [Reevesia pubescens]